MAERPRTGTPEEDAIDLSTMLDALAFLLDEDDPLPAPHRQGVALLLAGLAARAERLYDTLASPPAG